MLYRKAPGSAAVFEILAIYRLALSPCNREFRHDADQHVHSLIERRQRYSLIISVHSLQIFFRQRKWHQAIGLDVVESQLRGIRRPRRLDWQHQDTGKPLRGG